MKAEVRLRGRRFDIRVPLGEGPVVPTNGGARIEEQPRVEDDPLTVYEGNELVQLDVPVLLDGWPNRSVRDELNQILNLCRGRGNNRPPAFTATGPMPYSGMRFIMAALPDFGRADFHERTGALLRQWLTLKLIQFENPDVIRVRKRRRSSPSNGGTYAPAVVTTKQGDTLIKLAGRYLNDPSRAKEIGKLNGIRDVRKKLPAGRKIKIPGG